MRKCAHANALRYHRFIIRSSVTLDSVAVTNNLAGFDGGGLYAEGSTIEASMITAVNNTAGFVGGGIGAIQSTLGARHVITARNTAMNGGGLFVSRKSALTAFDMTATRNWAERDGGGLYVGAFSTAAIANSSITSNDADAGGALFATDSQEVWLRHMRIERNEARDGGGLHLDRDATCQLVDCDLSWNRATEHGGGASVNAYATLNAVASRITNNAAGSNGGGVHVRGTSPARLDVFVPFDAGAAMATTARQFFNRTMPLEITPGAGHAVHSLTEFSCGNATYCNETQRPGRPPRSKATLVSVGTIFMDNFAGYGGGAVSAADDGFNHVDVWDTLFESNVAFMKGGALDLGGHTTANISYSHMLSNQALEDGLSTGGALDIRTDTHFVRHVLPRVRQASLRNWC